jgi:hypothetical protein
MLTQAIILSGILLIVAYHVQGRSYETLVYLLLPLNLFFDLFSLHFQSPIGGSLFAIGRVGVIGGILVFLAVNRFRYTVLFNWLFLFFGYLVILLVYRSLPGGELNKTVDFILRIGLSMFCIHVAYMYVTTMEHLKALNRYALFTILAFIGYLILVNVTDIGGNLYISEEEFDSESGVISTGALLGNNFYTLAYLLALFPLFYKTNFKGKPTLWLNVMLGVGVILAILPFRRTAILILAMCYAYYLLNARHISYKIARSILTGGVVLLLASPLYIGYLYSIIEVRGDKGANPFSVERIEGEARTLEIFYVTDLILTKSEITQTLFGIKFQTKGVVPGTIYTRSLHSDYSNLLYSTGLVGLVLYILFYVGIYRLYGHVRRFSPDMVLNITFKIFFFTSILLSYPGRFTSISYRTVVFLYMGAILSIMYHNKVRVLRERASQDAG